MNNELLTLYQADRQERVMQPQVNTAESKAMRARDWGHRVMQIVATGDLPAAEDYYHAARIMNHGDTPDDAKIAHLLAACSTELGHRLALWLVAVSYDRWQMYEGNPQKYGTNNVYDGWKDRLWDVDPATTDEERAEWYVPSLAEQLRKAEKANRHRVPMSEKEQQELEANAPEWLRAALKEWRSEESNPEEGSQSRD